jgi:hypothetical protein
MGEQIIVKTYTGREAEATMSFQADTALMAAQGYFPVFQSWIHLFQRGLGGRSIRIRDHYSESCVPPFASKGGRYWWGIVGELVGHWWGPGSPLVSN